MLGILMILDIMVTDAIDQTKIFKFDDNMIDIHYHLLIKWVHDDSVN